MLLNAKLCIQFLVFKTKDRNKNLSYHIGNHTIQERKLFSLKKKQIFKKLIMSHYTNDTAKHFIEVLTNKANRRTKHTHTLLQRAT